MNKKSLEDSRVEQEDSEWPPPPKTSPPKDSVIPSNSRDEPFDAVVGMVFGFFINIAVVVGGELLLIIVGTMIFGFSQPGQTEYPPILPYFVLDIMFVFCQSPTVLLFLSKRLQKGYYAYGMLLGGIAGSAFLMWFWECIFLRKIGTT